MRIRIAPEEPSPSRSCQSLRPRPAAGPPCECARLELICTVSIYLIVTYPETYPDVIPGLSFEPAGPAEEEEDDEDEEEDGRAGQAELTEEEEESLRGKLETVVSLSAVCLLLAADGRQAEESLGMAMTFTLAQACREALAEIVEDRIRREKEEDDRKAREYEEVCPPSALLAFPLSPWSRPPLRSERHDAVRRAERTPGDTSD